MDDFLDMIRESMGGQLERLAATLAKVRTGRATPKLLDPVIVEVASYGASMPINQLATVQAPDARLLVVTPWDKTTLQDVERAIVAAGLGLNPSSDGQVIRVPVPPLTSDRRKTLERQVRQDGEDSKVSIRKERREGNDQFKEMEKDGDISEDDLRKVLLKVQELTDSHTAKVDEVVEAKVQEINEL